MKDCFIRHLIELDKEEDILIRCYNDIRTLSEEGLMTLLCVMIDLYGADHGWTPKKTQGVLEDMLTMQKIAHETEGLPKCTE